MERSEKYRFSHKSKEKEKDKKKKKGDSAKIKDNISQQQDLISGSIVQNQSNQTQIKNNLPLQDSSSFNQNQNQKMMYSHPVVVVNQGQGVPQTCLNNQTNNFKIKVSIKPIKIICPYCHQSVSTIIEDKCNCCSFFCYMIMMIIFPVFLIYIMCVNIEDCYCKFGCAYSDKGCFPTCCVCPNRSNLDGCLCCCDVSHYCPSCGNFIGLRNSVSDICPPCCCSCCK